MINLCNGIFFEGFINPQKLLDNDQVICNRLYCVPNSPVELLFGTLERDHCDYTMVTIRCMKCGCRESFKGGEGEDTKALY